MARAAAKGGKRPRPDARSRQQQRPSGGGGRRQLSKTEQDLFFTRIRRRGKWAFIIFGAVFGLGIALALILAVTINHGGSGGTSVSSLQKRVADHPKDAAAWQKLASGWQLKPGHTADAIDALQHATRLRPRNADGWGQLGQAQAAFAQQLTGDLGVAQSAYVAAQTAATQPIAPTNKLKDVLGTNDVQTALESKAAEAQTRAATIQAEVRSEYVAALASSLRAAKLRPNDAGSWNTVVFTGIGAISSLSQLLGIDPALARPTVEAYHHLSKLDPTAAQQWGSRIKILEQVLKPPKPKHR